MDKNNLIIDDLLNSAHKVQSHDLLPTRVLQYEIQFILHSRSDFSQSRQEKILLCCVAAV